MLRRRALLAAPGLLFAPHARAQQRPLRIITPFATGGATDYLGTLGSSIPGVGAMQFQTTAQAGARLTIPLYQGGSPAAQERQAQDRASQALEQVVATERNVIQQVRSAYSAWQASQAIIASSQTAVSAAALSLEGTRAEQSVGTRQIIDVLNERFGTQFSEEDRLFFQQIKERACKSDRVVQTALANPLDKFELGIRKLIEDLMIERMAENDKIVTRYMVDHDFQGTAFPILAREIFEAVRAMAVRTAPGQQADDAQLELPAT